MRIDRTTVCAALLAVAGASCARTGGPTEPPQQHATIRATAVPPPAPAPGELVLTLDRDQVRLRILSESGAPLLDSVVPVADEIALHAALKQADSLRAHGPALRVIADPCLELRVLTDVMVAGHRASTWTSNFFLHLRGHPRAIPIQNHTTPPEWARSPGIATLEHSRVYVGWPVGTARFEYSNPPLDARFSPPGDDATLREANAECGTQHWAFETNLNDYIRARPEECHEEATLVVPAWLSLGLVVRIREDLEAMARDACSQVAPPDVALAMSHLSI